MIINPYRFASAYSNTKSLNFDGIDDKVDCGNGSDLQITGDISISCWFKTTDSLSVLVSKRNSALGFNGYGYQLYISGDKIYFLVTLSGGVPPNTYKAQYVPTGPDVTDGQWHHVLGTIEQGVAISISVDGNPPVVTSLTVGTYVDSTTPLLLGFNQVGAGHHYFEGLMDEVSVFDALITSSDVRSSSGKPINLTGLSNLVAWYRMGENSTYQTPQILMPENLNKDKVSNYSMAFDGVDDVIPIRTMASMIGVFDEVSYSCWIKTSVPGVYLDYQAPFGGYSNAGAGLNIGRLGTPFGTTDLVIYSGGLIGTTILNDGNWHHLVSTFNNTTKESTWYVDENLEGTKTLPSYITHFAISIGAGNGTGDYYFFNGNIDECSVWSSVLTQSEVTNLYNGGPTDLTSLSPYGWYRMGEGSKFTSQWLVPNSALSNYSKFSFDFDGTDDVLTLSSAMSTSGTDWSVSFWMKSSQTGGNKTILGSGASKYISLNWNKLVFFSSDNSFDITSVLTVNDGAWHNIVFTYNYTTGAWILYIDDSVDTSQTATTGIDIPTWNTFASRLGASFYAGNLNECAYFNTALTSGNISTIFGTGQPSDLTSLSPVAWWRLGEDATYNAAVGVSGNTTADVSALQLNDGGATFLSDNISIGDLVRNTTDDTITHIAAIVSDTQINIDDDIFPVGSSSGDGYKVTGPVVWTVPDQIGSNDGTSANMSIQDLQGEAPNYSGAGTSSNMYIEDKVGNAPNSENNALSYNMYPDDIDTDVPS